MRTDTTLRPGQTHDVRERGFQPPWYTVRETHCYCGRVWRVRVTWHGGTPPGASPCACGRLISFSGHVTPEPDARFRPQAIGGQS